MVDVVERRELDQRGLLLVQMKADESGSCHLVMCEPVHFAAAVHGAGGTGSAHGLTGLQYLSPTLCTYTTSFFPVEPDLAVLYSCGTCTILCSLAVASKPRQYARGSRCVLVHGGGRWSDSPVVGLEILTAQPRTSRKQRRQPQAPIMSTDVPAVNLAVTAHCSSSRRPWLGAAEHRGKEHDRVPRRCRSVAGTECGGRRSLRHQP